VQRLLGMKGEPLAEGCCFVSWCVVCFVCEVWKVVCGVLCMGVVCVVWCVWCAVCEVW
jgi:hypothetical protein